MVGVESISIRFRTCGAEKETGGLDPGVSSEPLPVGDHANRLKLNTSPEAAKGLGAWVTTHVGRPGTQGGKLFAQDLLRGNSRMPERLTGQPQVKKQTCFAPSENSAMLNSWSK